MFIIYQRLSTLKQLFESLLESTESSFSDCIRSISSCFVDLSQNERESVAEMFMQHLESFDETMLNESQNTAPAATILKLKLIFALECRNCYATTVEVAADSKISDWISDNLRRLRVCISDRRTWKQFLEAELVSRYSEMFGHTLLDVYMNLGIEPPDCLPKDADLSGSYSFNMGIVDELEGRVTEVRCPFPQASPRSARMAVRQSLPRALFTDCSAVVVATTPNSSNTPAHHSGSCDCVTPSPLLRSMKIDPSSVNTSSLSYRLTRGIGSQLETSTSLTPKTAPQLVLIPSSRSRRRKAHTPTKRMVQTKRRTKGAIQTSQLVTSPAAGVLVKDNKAPHTSSSAVVSRKKPFSAKTSCRHSSSAKPVGKLHSSSAASGHVTPRDRHRNYRRSVHETPNPEKSHPRWERALLAAAEKTKSKAVIVEESPIKPSSLLGSPLRRLRRANSMFVNLFHLEANTDSASLQPASGSVHKALSFSLSPSLSTAKQASSQQPNQRCLSVGMSRAERWLRRQLDEEASLSQFSNSPPTKPKQESDAEVLIVGQHTPSSGLLSILPDVSGVDLRRRNSNLFANIVSPTATSGGQEQFSPILPVHHRRTPIKRMSKRDLQTCATTCATPRSASRSQRKSVSVKAGEIFASSYNSRRRHLSGSSLFPVTTAFSRDIPISPQVFDEEAMFLGRDEFLNKTANTTPSFAGEDSSLRTPGSIVAGDVTDTEAVYPSLRKRCRLTSHMCSPMKPPVFRLAPTVCSPVSVAPSPRATNPAMRARQRHQREPSVCQLSPSMSRFNRPARSPFAPLHVFNCPPASTCEFDAVTTFSNSQSGSALVAMRTQLFGGSNTNSNDADFENIPLHLPPNDDTENQSLHTWEEEGCSVDSHTVSSGLQRLSDSYCPPECSIPVGADSRALDTSNSCGTKSKSRQKPASTETVNTRVTVPPHRSLFH